MIKVKNLYMKEINSRITVNIPTGITYLTGKNGSGKTIFLDYLTRIRKYEKNVITGNENAIYMRQNFSFYNRIKVKEFIDFVYELCGIKDKNEFFEFLKRNNVPFDMKKLENTKLGMLSGGERRTIYLLVILSIERAWYILDEPFVNIDKDMKIILTNLISKLKNEGRSIIFTNHENVEDYFGKGFYHTINFEELLQHD